MYHVCVRAPLPTLPPAPQATRGGARRLCADTHIPFLGSVPLDPRLGRLAEEGRSAFAAVGEEEQQQQRSGGGGAVAALPGAAGVVGVGGGSAAMQTDDDGRPDTRLSPLLCLPALRHIVDQVLAATAGEAEGAGGEGPPRPE